MAPLFAEAGAQNGLPPPVNATTLTATWKAHIVAHALTAQLMERSSLLEGKDGGNALGHDRSQ
eukprot:6567736-Alexandrium_andersonii.AAC.1